MNKQCGMGKSFSGTPEKVLLRGYPLTSTVNAFSEKTETI